MIGQSSGNTIPIVPLVIGIVASGMGCVIILVTMYMAGGDRLIAEVLATSTPTSTPTSTATATPLATATPSITPTPTVTPTLTPSNTPLATATSTQRPAPPPPTKTPTPQPTDPPPPTEPPLSYWYFMTLLDFHATTNGCVLAPNSCLIWYDFTIRHSGGGVQLGYIGVSAYRTDGSFYRFVYSYIDYYLKGDLQWHNNISLEHEGSYYLYFVLCYDNSNTCDASSSAKWERLGSPISLTVTK